MELAERHIVVTGGAGGIGSALVRSFVEEGARAVVVADRDLQGAQAVAGELGAAALAVEFDAGSEGSVRELIATATDANGPIDIFVSNAGIGGMGGGPVETTDAAWDEAWRVHCCPRCSRAARAI
jgi:NAD(P)-dependent dehydrogenase (short-subunit alcohol dehydrogenase family)